MELTVGVLAASVLLAPGVADAAGQTISGRVWFDLDVDAVIDVGEPGAAGIKVDLASSSSVVATTTTAADGTYAFGPAAGTYDVKIQLGRSQRCSSLRDGLSGTYRTLRADPRREGISMLLGTHQIAGELRQGNTGEAWGRAVFAGVNTVLGAKGVSSAAVAGSRKVGGALTVSFQGLSDDVARGFAGIPTTFTDDAARIATNKVAATGEDLLKPGPWAEGSVPSSAPGKITQAERNALNPIGDEFGCHSCGATSPGTKSGNWVGDHQPVSSQVPPGTPQVLYPQCLTCSNDQGLYIINMMRQGPR